MAATASQTNLAGLPRRLVQDGIVTEDVLADATEKARNEKLPLVAYLVNEELADARAIAVAASHEFGVPLLDLDAVDDDIDVVRAVDQKLISKHRVLPLVRRGQRLVLGGRPLAEMEVRVLDPLLLGTPLQGGARIGVAAGADHRHGLVRLLLDEMGAPLQGVAPARGLPGVQPGGGR